MTAGVVLTTLLVPTAGTAVVAGQDLLRAPREVRRRIGYVGQGGCTEPEAQVGEELVDQGRLYGMAEADARSRIEESGLTPAVDYEGEGETRCGVVRQSPSAGSEVEEGSTVQLTVKRAADTEGCKPESDETEAPNEEQ